MSFKFNFSNATENSQDLHDPKLSDDKFSLNPNETCEYLTHFSTNVSYSSFNSRRFGDFEIKYVTKESMGKEQFMCLDYDIEESDLIPYKYEGGFTTWECSFDLANFIVNERCIKDEDNVLELGCGVGLPGIVANKLGASVTFQDYNSDVLKMITSQNVHLNIPETISNDKCRYLSGDWKCIEEKYFSGDRDKYVFDVILTSETIYNQSNQRKLLDLMKSTLKPSGAIYLAAKVHYFGVGGGILDFQELVDEDGTFEYFTVFRSETNSVERQILKLSYKC